MDGNPVVVARNEKLNLGDGAVRAGWLGSIIGIVAIFGSGGFGDGNMQAIGAALAVCSLTILYGYFFKIGSILLD